MLVQFIVASILLVAGVVCAIKHRSVEVLLREFAVRAPRLTREPTRMPARMLSILYPVVMVLGSYLLFFEIR